MKKLTTVLLLLCISSIALSSESPLDIANSYEAQAQAQQDRVNALNDALIAQRQMEALGRIANTLEREEFSRRNGG